MKYNVVRTQLNLDFPLIEVIQSHRTWFYIWNKSYMRSIKRPFHQGLFWSRKYLILCFVDRSHFCKNSREPAITVEHYLILSGEIWCDRLSPSRAGYRKSDQRLFFNMLKNRSRSKTVNLWSSWSIQDNNRAEIDSSGTIRSNSGWLEKTILGEIES